MLNKGKMRGKRGKSITRQTGDTTYQERTNGFGSVFQVCINVGGQISDKATFFRRK